MSFKRLLWFAPENYMVGWVYRLIAREGEEAAYKEARRQIAELTQKTIRRYYGRTHPQARV